MPIICFQCSLSQLYKFKDKKYNGMTHCFNCILRLAINIIIFTKLTTEFGINLCVHLSGADKFDLLKYLNLFLQPLSFASLDQSLCRNISVRDLVWCEMSFV